MTLPAATTTTAHFKYHGRSHERWQPRECLESNYKVLEAHGQSFASVVITLFSSGVKRIRKTEGTPGATLWPMSLGLMILK